MTLQHLEKGSFLTVAAHDNIRVITPLFPVKAYETDCGALLKEVFWLIVIQ